MGWDTIAIECVKLQVLSFYYNPNEKEGGGCRLLSENDRENVEL
jgi:hypothetical protein